MQQSHETICQMNAEASLIDELYRRHSPALFAFLRQHTSSREDAEDLLLEVFIAALEYQGLMALPDGRQLAWLWRVARNKAIDSYRRNTRHPVMVLGQIEDQLFVDEDFAPEALAQRQDEHHQLRATLEALTPLQREVLYLRFANDLRCSEIAQVLGRSEGAIRVHLMRTLQHLRAIYAKRR